MCTLVSFGHHHSCQRAVSAHHGRWLGVNNKADISANKEAGNCKYYVSVGGSRVDPEARATIRGLHDGAGEAAALFEQGEARLGEG